MAPAGDTNVSSNVIAMGQGKVVIIVRFVLKGKFYLIKIKYSLGCRLRVLGTSTVYLPCVYSAVKLWVVDFLYFRQTSQPHFLLRYV